MHILGVQWEHEARKEVKRLKTLNRAVNEWSKEIISGIRLRIHPEGTGFRVRTALT
jgi:hypothetical protein